MKSIVLLMMLTSCSTVHAQSCGTSYARSYGQNYSYRQSYSYSPPSYSYVAPTYVAPTKVYKEYEPTYYKFLLAFPVALLPSYGAAYVEPPTGQTPLSQQPVPQAQTSQMQQLLNQNVQILEALKKLDERTKVIEQRVEKLERVRGPQPQAQPKQEKQQAPPSEDELTKAFVQVNADSCAACHTRSNAAKHGGDFVLTEDDGRLVKLTADQREEVERQITGPKPKMPKLTSARAKEANVKPLDQERVNVILATLDRQKLLARKE